MTMLLRRTRLPLLLFLILSAGAHAQVITSETQRVLLELAVTDKKGAYVQDLQPAEVRVWEDGKPQQILSLTRETEASRPHFTVLLFDLVSLNPRDQVWAREAANHFIDANAAPDHSMAVVEFAGSLRVAQTFTADVRRLKSALDRQGVATQANFLVRDLLRDLRTLFENLDSVPGRKNVLFFSAGFPVDSNVSPWLDRATEAANQANVAIHTIHTPVSTSAPPLTPPDPLQRIMTARGGRGGSMDVPIAGGQAGTAQAATANLGVLVTLAEETGGFVVRPPDETEMLNRIGQEQREYYVLSYRPPEGSQGKCHELRVRVDRKDTNVRSRDSYCHVTPGDVLSGNPVERELEQHATNRAAGNLGTSMQAPFFYTGPNSARVALAMEIQTSQVEFKREKGHYLASFDILGVATRPDGSIGARFSDTVKLDFDNQDEVNQFKRAPYRYKTQFDAASGDYKLVIVASAGQNRFGRTEAPLLIPPYQPDQLALSSLALSTSFRPAAAAAGDLEQLLMDDSKKFVVNEVEADLLATPILTRNQQAAFYAEVYEPVPNPAAPVAVAIQIRILNAANGATALDSGPMRLDVSPTGGTGKAMGTPILQMIPAESLPPGRYTLDFQVLDGANRKANRTLAFEVR